MFPGLTGLNAAHSLSVPLQIAYAIILGNSYPNFLPLLVVYNVLIS